MDPISAAGIGLSVTSLCLQAFAGCVKGFELLVNAAEMPARYQYLRTRLRLEQSRLLNWGEQVGLLEEMLDRPSQALSMSHNMIIDVLLEMQAAFRSCLKVTNKYDSLVIAAAGRQPIDSGSTKQAAFMKKARCYWDNASTVGKRLEW
ncbi:uncharacterized protein HMPREF1541_06571 [Cyphellophora europaea CBS 101466]|uniref:Prion-inhibition and propagation HeLo domain-containing protein n=1 Tax=Cyphellophora europaea (strain CBS 101466) TaxID=1220924 RepID=W2RQE2_CYPE1|nr:uncharacterized protein HMPREF1541_06571 [Cyphellophora europaea CBS 101466]ETN38535.1 hypothetical protein HMPREF1541_06571 [Cyphellophora europaea CBS 101466]